MRGHSRLAAELSGTGFGGIKDTGIERLYIFPPWFQRAAAARQCVAVLEPLWEGPETLGGHKKPLHATDSEVWVQRRPQDVGDARAVGHLQGSAAYREWCQLRRDMWQASESAKHSHLSKGHSATIFGICPSGFQYCFGPVFPHYALVPPFGHGNVPLWCWKYILCFLIFQGITVKKLSWVSEVTSDFRFLNSVETERLWGLLNSMHFASRDGHGPRGARGGLWQFEWEMSL